MLDLPMNIAIFVIWWWIALFAMLPIGVRSVGEAGEAAPGHDRGAPVRPNLWRKALYALIAAAILWAITAVVIFYDPFNMRPDIK
jgi:predicted secreted protein